MHTSRVGRVSHSKNIMQLKQKCLFSKNSNCYPIQFGMQHWIKVPHSTEPVPSSQDQNLMLLKNKTG